ncbi:MULTISPECIES: penicillin acylase family protein [Nocardioides]|uniref:Penicillin acylase family protein n=1 Tax=Nocardioides vastitatis TaxID=2568655 RepID=A0ABW0ZA30_9ACTN|nr:penicillin acylase family protein [Nocardioides sp.]THJ05346.1 penicillin acylase family protein [Nocardioides sp.]
MARIYKDAYGVPHVRASSVLDLARAQGEVTARDRTWQMEWLRLRGLGETASVVADAGEAWDDLARRMRVARTAQRALASCSPETRAFLTAYADGVNAGLDSVDAEQVPELRTLGIPAGAWQPWTPLATFLAQHVLFGTIGTRLWERLARSVLGDDARHLRHEGPLTSGSNAWAVGGARTASGMPLIGGDPHRNLEQPGVYQQVRLACEDPDDSFDVVGFSFVGVPGVQHFAHAGEVAWAITNAAADYQDVVDVRPGDALSDDLLRLSDTLAVRTTSWVLGDLGFDALLPLLRARSVHDVDRAFDAWVEPVNNLLIADRSGAVRYRIAGKVPVRDASGGWQGWLADPHRVDAGPDEELVTANERRGPESERIGSSFAPPYRAERIRELLAGRSGLTTADFSEIHNDTLLKSASVLTELVPGAFDEFDGFMAADSAAAARFAAWRSALVRRLVDEPVFAGLVDPSPEHDHGPLFTAVLGLEYRLGLALATLASEALAGRPPYGIDLFAHAKAALADVEAGEIPATWGDTHVAQPVHALVDFDAGIPSLPVSGDQDTVRTMGSYPAISDAATRGSVARYVWDLADRQAGGWVVPTGASGLPGAHYVDQLEPWVEGRLLPIVTDWELLTEESR